MESAFIYNRPVTGKNFVGRKAETELLSDLLSRHRDVVLYDVPKAGKTSLIQQSFYNMKVNSMRFDISEISLLNIRTAADLCVKLGSTLLGSCFQTEIDKEIAVGQYLDGTHFVFDSRANDTTGTMLALTAAPDDEDLKAVFRLPFRLALERCRSCYVIMDEFHNVCRTEDGDRICSILHETLSGIPDESRKWCSYIFTGSSMNAMKDIFEWRKLFYKDVVHVKLGKIDPKDIVDHFTRGFMAGGKVIDRNLAMAACGLFKGNIWYINHFGSICDSLSRGYMTDIITNEAMEDILAIHEPGFIATMNDLTTYQICLLRAILDGHVKLSSMEVIQKYRLNSSANVRRLKDALCKKEIVTFDEEDMPEILDPLFEHWAKKYYFHIKQ